MHARKTLGFAVALQRGDLAPVDLTIWAGAEADMNASHGSKTTDGNAEGLICTVVPVIKAHCQMEPVAGKSRLVSRFQV